MPPDRQRKGSGPQGPRGNQHDFNPETLLRWHRELVAENGIAADSARKSGVRRLLKRLSNLSLEWPSRIPFGVMTGSRALSPILAIRFLTQPLPTSSDSTASIRRSIVTGWFEKAPPISTPPSKESRFERRQKIFTIRDLAYVSNQLGHSNPSITLRIYSHWVPGTRRVTTSILDATEVNKRQMSEKNGGDEKEENAVSC